ncbi:type VI secretion system tube protein Hcp, partial [Proteus mirabilis]
QPYEDITIRYESISWNHICAGTSGYSISKNI